MVNRPGLELVTAVYMGHRCAFPALSEGFQGFPMTERDVCVVPPAGSIYALPAGCQERHPVQMLNACEMSSSSEPDKAPISSLRSIPNTLNKKLVRHAGVWDLTLLPIIHISCLVRVRKQIEKQI